MGGVRCSKWLTRAAVSAVLTISVIATLTVLFRAQLLFVTAEYGMSSATQLVIGLGADVNAYDSDRLTPLMWAVQQPKLDVVQLLLRSGAKVNACGDGNSTPLMYAGRQSNAAIAKALLAAGADIRARDSYGGTALMWAAGRGHPEVVRALLEAGADATAQTPEGYTALAASMGSGDPGSITCDELLIDARGLKGIRFPFGLIQHSFTARGHAEILIEHGVDVNERAPDGSTPLMLFAEYGNTDVMSLLVEHGALIDAASKVGHTALTEAVNWGWPDAVDYLLRNGADPRRKRDGLNLLDIARRNLSEVQKAPAPAVIPTRARVVQLLEARQAQ